MSGVDLRALPTHQEAADYADAQMRQVAASGVMPADAPTLQAGGELWQRAYREATVRVEQAADAEAAEALSLASQGVVDPETLWTCGRPEVEHIYAMARRFKLSPWALLGGTLGRAAACIPWHVPFRSFLGSRPVNLIIAVSGSTGSGKTATESAVGEIFDFGRDLGFAHEVGSGEAIPAIFGSVATKSDKELSISKGDLVWHSEDHLGRVIFDEIGRLNAVQSRQGATVIEYLKSAESGAVLGRKLASGEGVEIPPGQYRLIATLNVQPERAHLITSADEAAGGLPGRMLWVDAGYAPFVGLKRDRRYPERHRIPRTEWTSVFSIEALGVMEEAFEAQQDAALAGTLDPMDSHAALLQAKVACCLMVLAGRTELIEEDWSLAGLVMEHSRRTRRRALRAIAQAEQKSAGAGDALIEASVIEQMRKKRSQGMTMGAARRELRSDRRTVWDGLVASGGATVW